jgi:hypothetical protein
MLCLSSYKYIYKLEFQRRGVLAWNGKQANCVMALHMASILCIHFYLFHFCFPPPELECVVFSLTLTTCLHPVPLCESLCVCVCVCVFLISLQRGGEYHVGMTMSLTHYVLTNHTSGESQLTNTGAFIPLLQAVNLRTGSFFQTGNVWEFGQLSLYSAAFNSRSWQWDRQKGCSDRHCSRICFLWCALRNE